jgi:hypothetical protein
MEGDTPKPPTTRAKVTRLFRAALLTSGNPRGGDLIATETHGLDEAIDNNRLYEFDLIPPPTIDHGVVNMQHVDPTKNDHPKWMRDMWSEKTAAVAVTGSELESKLESIPSELSKIVRPGEELFVTFATWSVKDFVVNWLKSADALNLKPVFVGALDEEIRDFCVKRGVPTMLLKGNSVLKNRNKSFITAGDASFKKMGTVKTKFVQDLLEIGVAPILTGRRRHVAKRSARVFQDGLVRRRGRARVHGLHRRRGG